MHHPLATLPLAPLAVLLLVHYPQLHCPRSTSLRVSLCFPLQRVWLASARSQYELPALPPPRYQVTKWCGRGLEKSGVKNAAQGRAAGAGKGSSHLAAAAYSASSACVQATRGGGAGRHTPYFSSGAMSILGHPLNLPWPSGSLQQELCA